MEKIIRQFEQTFRSSEDCHQYLYQLKWPHGYECPRCMHKHCYTIATRMLPLYECRSCRHQTTLTSGTIMDKSRTPIRRWLLALFLFVHPGSNGINAVSLAELLQVTYKTAWSMLSKIRYALSKMDADKPLSGTVEAIVASYCRPLIGSLLPHPKESPVVVAANLDCSYAPSNIKLKIADLSCLRETNHNVLNAEGEEWFSTSHASVAESVSFFRMPIKHRAESRALRAIAKQAQQWAARTYRGISKRNLQLYLDEFCFRFNWIFHRQSESAPLLSLCHACLKTNVRRPS